MELPYKYDCIQNFFNNWHIEQIKTPFSANILEIIFNLLILSRLHYGILLWGYNHKRIGNSTKKAIRIITLSKYLAHSEPLFKRLNKLTIEDIFTLNQLKFCFKLINNKSPDYFENMNLVKCSDIHRHDTRKKNRFHTWKVSHVFAEKCIRFSVPHILNNTNTDIIDKIYTHSLAGFINYVKIYLLNKYSYQCTILNCYVCPQS